MDDQLSEANERAGNAFDRLIGNLANAGVTTYVTQATGSPESGAAIGAMAAPLGEEISFALRKFLGIKERRAQVLIESASIQGDISVDELVAAISDDPSRLALLSRALDAAANANTLLKIALLANVLASGALRKDDASVDEEILAMDALAQLETPHLRMLVILLDRSPVWRTAASERRKLLRHWPEERIVQKDVGLSVAFPAIAAKLQSLGLVSSMHYGDENLWSLTSFGQVCLGKLAGTADQGKPEGM
ncbi:hypothetical protein [Actinoplanes sp. G11-F43]|uniref:hypothetical protein n=1 Tax=Actinoplanes sp. G11-F43 TaxID=3424130 RepID=UPI003D329EEA